MPENEQPVKGRLAWRSSLITIHDTDVGPWFVPLLYCRNIYLLIYLFNCLFIYLLTYLLTYVGLAKIREQGARERCKI